MPKYVGQTGRLFYTMHRKHLHAFKYNAGKSNFAEHILDNTN
jgi:hypothetical protein